MSVELNVLVEVCERKEMSTEFKPYFISPESVVKDIARVDKKN